MSPMRDGSVAVVFSTPLEGGRTMKTTILKPALLKAALAASVGVALCAALPANAESTSATGAGALSTAAHVDFSIVIPRFLSFRVGTTGGTIDLITFTVPAASLGNATPVAGVGGD